MQLPKCLNPSRNDTPWSLPADVRDLAIRLETEGVSDAVAREDFGFADTWDMAEAHFSAVSQKYKPPRASLEPVLGIDIRRPVREYVNGVLFALPLLISCVAILLLRFSLWGSDLPAGQASALGLAVVSSFIASGGFVQAMTRQGLWYIGTRQFKSCARSTLMWFTRAAILLFVLGVAGIAISLHLDLLPAALCPMAAAFYFSLALLWLSSGILYMLQRSLLVAAAILLGILMVVLLHRGFGVALIGAQIASILIAALSAMVISIRILKAQTRGDKSIPVDEPLGRTLYYLAPYFAYGCLYYLFLFSDRLLAWTARTDAAGMAIQFRGAYEAAQDMALFAFIVQVGWVHSATASFYDYLKICQEELLAGQSEEFNRRLTRQYWRAGLQFVPLSIAASLGTFVWAQATGFLADALHLKVMLWSLIGYMFLVFSLRNVSLLFALSRPAYVVLTTGCACVGNITVAYLLSRFVTYDQAIVGFAFGAIVFAAFSTWYSIRILARLDYHYLASGS